MISIISMAFSMRDKDVICKYSYVSLDISVSINLSIDKQEDKLVFLLARLIKTCLFLTV